MDFEQKDKISNNEKNYHMENLKIVREFSKKLIFEMNSIIKAVVLFGSNTNNSNLKDSDIDVMIVLDNVNVYVTDELREAYKIIVRNLVDNISTKLHIMTINFSDYWDKLRKTDPIVINVLRTGVPIYDTGIIEPMQYLLEIGKIRPTTESINNYLSRSETLIEETQKHLQNAVLDLYYSCIDMVHSLIMTKGLIPSSPKEMPEIFKKHFKNTNIFKYHKNITKLYKISKDIEKGNSSVITGVYFDELKKETKVMINDLKKEIKKNLNKSK